MGFFVASREEMWGDRGEVGVEETEGYVEEEWISLAAPSKHTEGNSFSFSWRQNKFCSSLCWFCSLALKPNSPLVCFYFLENCFWWETKSSIDIAPRGCHPCPKERKNHIILKLSCLLCTGSTMEDSQNRSWILNRRYLFPRKCASSFPPKQSMKPKECLYICPQAAMFIMYRIRKVKFLLEGRKAHNRWTPVIISGLNSSESHAICSHRFDIFELETIY